MLKVWRGDNVVLEVPLQAGESVGSGGLHQRAFDARERDWSITCSAPASDG